MKSIKSITLTAEEFFRRGEKSSFFAEIIAEIKKEKKDDILDKDRLAKDREWNELINKIVGSEK